MLLLKLLEIFCSLCYDHCLVVATQWFHLFPCCCYSVVPSLSLLLLLSGSISFLVVATQWFHLFPCCCYSVVPSLSLLLLLSFHLFPCCCYSGISCSLVLLLKYNFCKTNFPQVILLALVCAPIQLLYCPSTSSWFNAVCGIWL